MGGFGDHDGGCIAWAGPVGKSERPCAAPAPGSEDFTDPAREQKPQAELRALPVSKQMQADYTAPRMKWEHANET